MGTFDIAAADRAFAATRANPRENYPSLFVIGLALATILSPFVLPATIAPLEGPQGRVLIVAPWVLAAVLVWMSWRRVRRHRANAAAISDAWDSAQLDDWDRLDASLAKLTNRPIRSAADRGRLLVMLAGLAERGKHFDVAAHIYERLLRERIGEVPLLQNAQLALASAKLRNEELTDAVELLDRLEKVEMPMHLRAVYEAIRLHQQVFMGHDADAVADADRRKSLFRRHLSTRAGYAYALLAAAFHRLGQSDVARQYWRDATTLVRPNDIVDRFELARAVSRAYTPVENPF